MRALPCTDVQRPTPAPLPQAELQVHARHQVALVRDGHGQAHLGLAEAVDGVVVEVGARLELVSAGRHLAKIDGARAAGGGLLDNGGAGVDLAPAVPGVRPGDAQVFRRHFEDEFDVQGSEIGGDHCGRAKRASYLVVGAGASSPGPDQLSAG